MTIVISVLSCSTMAMLHSLVWVMCSTVHLNMGVAPSGTRLISNATLADIHSPSSSLRPTFGYTRVFVPAAKENITIDNNGYGMGWFTEAYRGLLLCFSPSP